MFGWISILRRGRSRNATQSASRNPRLDTTAPYQATADVGRLIICLSYSLQPRKKAA
jgi:hypothetical protein